MKKQTSSMMKAIPSRSVTTKKTVSTRTASTKAVPAKVVAPKIKKPGDAKGAMLAGKNSLISHIRRGK